MWAPWEEVLPPQQAQEQEQEEDREQEQAACLHGFLQLLAPGTAARSPEHALMLDPPLALGFHQPKGGGGLSARPLLQQQQAWRQAVATRGHVPVPHCAPVPGPGQDHWPASVPAPVPAPASAPLPAPAPAAALAAAVPASLALLLYECGICGRRFGKSQALGGHMSGHRKEASRMGGPPPPAAIALHCHPGLGTGTPAPALAGLGIPCSPRGDSWHPPVTSAPRGSMLVLPLPGAADGAVAAAAAEEAEGSLAGPQDQPCPTRPGPVGPPGCSSAFAGTVPEWQVTEAVLEKRHSGPVLGLGGVLEPRLHQPCRQPLQGPLLDQHEGALQEPMPAPCREGRQRRKEAATGGDRTGLPWHALGCSPPAGARPRPGHIQPSCRRRTTQAAPARPCSLGASPTASCLAPPACLNPLCCEGDDPEPGRGGIGGGSGMTPQGREQCALHSASAECARTEPGMASSPWGKRKAELALEEGEEEEASPAPPCRQRGVVEQPLALCSQLQEEGVKDRDPEDSQSAIEFSCALSALCREMAGGGSDLGDAVDWDPQSVAADSNSSSCSSSSSSMLGSGTLGCGGAGDEHASTALGSSSMAQAMPAPSLSLSGQLAPLLESRTQSLSGAEGTGNMSPNLSASTACPHDLPPAPPPRLPAPAPAFLPAHAPALGTWANQRPKRLKSQDCSQGLGDTVLQTLPCPVVRNREGAGCGLGIGVARSLRGVGRASTVAMGQPSLGNADPWTQSTRDTASPFSAGAGGLWGIDPGARQDQSTGPRPHWGLASAAPLCKQQPTVDEHIKVLLGFASRRAGEKEPPTVQQGGRQGQRDFHKEQQPRLRQRPPPRQQHRHKHQAVSPPPLPTFLSRKKLEWSARAEEELLLELGLPDLTPVQQGQVLQLLRGLDPRQRVEELKCLRVWMQAQCRQEQPQPMRDDPLEMTQKVQPPLGVTDAHEEVCHHSLSMPCSSKDKDPSSVLVCRPPSVPVAAENCKRLFRQEGPTLSEQEWEDHCVRKKIEDIQQQQKRLESRRQELLFFHLLDQAVHRHGHSV